jgi:hypothetical protein
MTLPQPPDQAPPTPPTPAAAALSPAEHQLVRRIEGVEQENRRLKRQSQMTLVVTAVLLGVAAALVWTAARHGMPGFVPQVVESREFILRDREGHVRGAWGQDDQGSIRFVLQEPGNQTSIKLNLLPDGSSGLTFADSAGSARLIVAVLPDETVNLVFADGRGVARTVLGLNGKGGSTLVFGDGGGATRTAIGVDNRGRPVLTTGEVEAAPENVAEDSATTAVKPPPAKKKKK